MFFQRIGFVTFAGAFVTVVAACSEDPKAKKEEASAAKDPQAACEHLNNVCGGVQGFKKFECANTNADYAKLDASQKARVDSTVPCVLSSKTCEAAAACASPPSSDSTTTTDDDATPTDAEQACEHINSICKGEQGFSAQDCSNSNSEYQKLSAEDKQTADAIAPCIMAAKNCGDAFGCLEVGTKQQ
jgi:hypothetical protein